MNGLIHHIEIYVSDLKQTIDFWTWLLTEKFSYKIANQWEEGITYKIPNTASYIVFVQTEEKYLENAYNRKNTGLNHLAFHGNSRQFVDELTIELQEKGVNILYADKHPFAGGADYYAVFFEDPDRIKVEVVAMN